MKKKLEPSVLEKIMVHARRIDASESLHCRQFQIMISPLRPDTLILRWLTIEISNPDNPIQRYNNLCFYADGLSQDCSINYADQQEANEFFASLECLHQQTFST